MFYQLPATSLHPERPAMSEDTQSAELEKAVHLALSRIIGTQKGKRIYASRLPVIVGAAAGAVTVGKNVNTALRELGLSTNDLDDRWAVARTNGQLLDRELVE